MTDLSGKVAIVTGASRGIGAATARSLAESGAKVVLAARSLAACEALALELTAEGHAALAVECDVSRFAAVESLVGRCCAQFGGLDILINNAGTIDPIARIADSDPAAWAESLAVNLLGAYHALRAALPTMLSAGGGVVVNVSSGAASHPLEGWSAYCAGKAGLAMLTQSVAHEYGAAGIRAFGFRPGTVETRMQEKIRASRLNPVSRMGPEDHGEADTPARVIAWLCSEAAANLAGQELTISDAGLRARAGLRS